MKKIYLLPILLIISASLFSQISDRLKDGLKFYTNSKDSSHWIKLNMCSQIQARYTENNPSSLVNGFSQGYTTDLAIRRIRFVASGQLNDRVAFYMQFGQNSMTYLSARKTGAFFHDVTTDYAVIKKYFHLGFGLNGWNGPSRFSNTSVASIMPLDPPGYQEVTNDTYDQFVRRLGVYAKGKIGKLDYRLSAAKPFATQTGSAIDPLNNVSSTFSVRPPNLVYQGYLMYQFLDQESNFGPGTTGSYLGKKKIFNIGAGFYTQQKAMMYLDPHYATPDTVYQDITLFAADVFLDMPINKEKGNAISVYAAYSSYNYGTNFMRIQGPANPTNGVNTTAAAKTYSVISNYDKQNYGNAVPYLGTGNILYTQIGYKFKDDL
ncbi:MAG TPA: hypothetical protein VN026_15480, partial [Bacteroidia bacterium]|nr:hypothetical protein [Bacteroidia bacterium]